MQEVIKMELTRAKIELKRLETTLALGRTGQ